MDLCDAVDLEGDSRDVGTDIERSSTSSGAQRCKQSSLRGRINTMYAKT